MWTEGEEGDGCAERKRRCEDGRSSAKQAAAASGDGTGV
jgi:hypothetical protein